MNKRNIVIGIVVFILVVTTPLWLNIGRGADAAAPEMSYDTTAIKAMGDDAHCIYDAEYMRTHHMEILAQWKEQAIRDGNREFVAPDGTKYEVSLQNTCLECHSNYEDFCKKCHDYNDVTPNCWTCHVEPTAKNGGALKAGVTSGGDQ